MRTTDTKFRVGQEYYYTFTCDSDTCSYMTVVSRTEKTAMILGRHDKKPVRRKIHTHSGVESISDGNYSMAGSWYANRTADVDPEIEETVEPVALVAPESVEPSNLVAFAPKAPVAADKPVDPVEARIMETMGRKILVEALESQGCKTEVALINAILDRDHWKLLETLRGVVADIRSGAVENR